jgi:hypothetical protein
MYHLFSQLISLDVNPVSLRSTGVALWLGRTDACEVLALLLMIVFSPLRLSKASAFCEKGRYHRCNTHYSETTYF